MSLKENAGYNVNTTLGFRGGGGKGDQLGGYYDNPDER